MKIQSNIETQKLLNGYRIKGNPKGNISEQEDFLRFLLKTKKADKDNLFKQFMDNFPFEITRKYLSSEKNNFISYKRKNRRITNVLKTSGYTEENNLGKTYGNNIILPIIEFNKKQLELKTSMELLWKKVEEFKSKEAQRVKESEDNEKARENEWLKEYTISKNCFECGSQILFPSMDCSSIYESEANQIYNCVWSDMINGTKLCYDCQIKAERLNNWKIENIIQELNQTKEDIQQNPKALEILSLVGYVNVEIDVIEFCEKHRFDKKLLGSSEIKKLLNDICSRQDIKDIKFTYINDLEKPKKKAKEDSIKKSDLYMEYETIELSDEEKAIRYTYERAYNPEKYLEVMAWLESKS